MSILGDNDEVSPSIQVQMEHSKGDDNDEVSPSIQVQMEHILSDDR